MIRALTCMCQLASFRRRCPGATGGSAQTVSTCLPRRAAKLRPTRGAANQLSASNASCRGGDCQAARWLRLGAGQRRHRQGGLSTPRRSVHSTERKMPAPAVCSAANCMTRPGRCCLHCRFLHPCLSHSLSTVCCSARCPQVYKALRHGVQPVAVKVIPVSFRRLLAVCATFTAHWYGWSAA